MSDGWEMPACLQQSALPGSVWRPFPGKRAQLSSGQLSSETNFQLAVEKGNKGRPVTRRHKYSSACSWELNVPN